MLTQEQIAVLRDRAGQLADPINDFLLEDIARRISEAGQLTSTAAYQVWCAQNLGMSQREIKKELRKLLKVSHRDLRKLLTQSAETGYDFDIRYLPQVQAIPFYRNAVIQEIVRSAVELAQEDFTNLTQSLGMVDPYGRALPIQAAYRSCTDFAFQQVITGAADYNTAIRMATRNLAEQGVQTIDYSSGYHTSLEAAVRRSVMGGLGLMQEQISQKNHDDFGCDGWEISAHAASAPDHEPIQGRQYSDADYAALNNSLVRRIGTLNCGHAAFPIILGVSPPQYTPEELEKLRAENEQGVTIGGRHYTMYEATQRQRKLERSLRKQKRRVLMDDASRDDEKLLTDQTRLQRLRQEYKRFSGLAGLRTQYERTNIAGFGHEEAAQVRTAVNQNHKNWLKSIGAQDTELKALEKYDDAAYNNSPAYQMLSGYNRAVEKGDISPLVGLAEYERIGKEIQESIVGTTTATGVSIEGFATHFIDRVIGQTSEPHPNMRCGVPIADALDALKNPVNLGSVRTLDDGDIRQTIYGERAAVTISIRDKRLIQTNPWKGK